MTIAAMPAGSGTLKTENRGERMEQTHERTHELRRGQVVDCRSWVEFAIVESTIRGHKVRFREKVDPTEPDGVESTAQETT